jgi:hypothetical protein
MTSEQAPTRLDPEPPDTVADAGRDAAPRRQPVSDRHKVIVAAVTLVSVIVLTTLVFVMNSRYFEPEPGTTQAANEVAAASHPALDQPYSGHKPTSPGDRGGWEQLALLGVIVVALAGGTTAVVLSGRKARKANAALRR